MAKNKKVATLTLSEKADGCTKLLKAAFETMVTSFYDGDENEAMSHLCISAVFQRNEDAEVGNASMAGALIGRTDNALWMLGSVMQDLSQAHAESTGSNVANSMLVVQSEALRRAASMSKQDPSATAKEPLTRKSASELMAQLKELSADDIANLLG